VMLCADNQQQDLPAHNGSSSYAAACPVWDVLPAAMWVSVRNCICSKTHKEQLECTSEAGVCATVSLRCPSRTENQTGSAVS
jgi:hypothetical protein